MSFYFQTIYETKLNTVTLLREIKNNVVIFVIAFVV